MNTFQIIGVILTIVWVLSLLWCLSPWIMEGKLNNEKIEFASIVVMVASIMVLFVFTFTCSYLELF